MDNSKKLLKNAKCLDSASLKKTSRKNASELGEKNLHSVQAKLNHLLSQYLKKNSKLLLALSGGLDSCVLLHLLATAKQSFPFELNAMHVHHGLSSNADSWAEFCKSQCDLLNVPLKIVHVKVDKNGKLGIEATARKQRYDALFDAKINEIEPDFVVTAHHQDDQAETLLLQLFRGAGVKGLASMAVADHTRRLLRPLLDVSRQTLQDYAMQYNLSWCEDESNDDTQFERNFVRHELMPTLETRYQTVKSVLARTASHMADANILLNTLAEIDATPLLNENSICLQGLRKLDPARAKNVLRWWFAQNDIAMPNAEHLNEMMQQLLNAKLDAGLHIQLKHLSLKRYQERAYLCANNTPKPFDLVWNGESELNLPNGGMLVFTQVLGSGLALKLGMTKLRVTSRKGGERFKPNAVKPTRTLKHLLQEANVPPWQRDSLPLVYWEDTLAYVPNIGVAHDLQACAGEKGLVITWQGNVV